MKIVRKSAEPANESTEPRAASRAAPWKVLVVDDEPDVRRLTTLNLRGFQFAGRPLELIEASSGGEGRKILRDTPDIALALIDVVMETDDAGLKLVEFIRDELRNTMIRLVIRTGQPGVAPERYVIDNFDIDDYKDKTELTAQKLYTTVRSALKSYRDLQSIELNRIGLGRILEVTPELYNLHRDKLEDYFRGLLVQVIGICNLGHSGLISTIDGMVITLEGRDIRIRAGTGEFNESPDSEARRREIVSMCSQAVISHAGPSGLRAGAMVVPLQVKDEIFGFIYLEGGEQLSTSDLELITIMANQCAAALQNFRLHHSLEEAYDEAIDMLGQVAEFKDSATGTHIRRIQEHTRRLACALGCNEDEAAFYAKASRLHDIGKVGIPDDVLRKPGKLTDDEYEVIKRHTRIGDTILARSSSMAGARVVARSHHEKWNGAGYPDGVAGEDIPFGARLVAVVDVFDALVSTRPYKDSWRPEKAREELVRGRGTHFDPKIVDAFLALLDKGELDDLISAAQKPSNVSPYGQ